MAICCCGKLSHPAVDMGIARRGETLFIFGADQREICSLAVPPLDADLSWACVDGVWGYCLEPTPGRENGRIFASLDPVQVDALGLSVSELLIEGSRAAVLPDGSYCDFVEFCNENYDDEFMENRFQSMTMNPDNASRAN